MSKVRHPELLAEIDSFLADTGMGPSYFGKASVKNSEVVDRIRNGGRVWPETEDRLRRFMVERRDAPSERASA